MAKETFQQRTTRTLEDVLKQITGFGLELAGVKQQVQSQTATNTAVTQAVSGQASPASRFDFGKIALVVGIGVVVFFLFSRGK